MAWKQGIIGSLNVAAAVLAARFVLLLSVIGAILLVWMALALHDPFRLIAVGIYTVTVVLPLVWLASRS